MEGEIWASAAVSSLKPLKAGVVAIKKSCGTTMVDIESTPSRIRTCDLLIRSQLLYPAELSGQMSVFLEKWCKKERQAKDFFRYKPTWGCTYSVLIVTASTGVDSTKKIRDQLRAKKRTRRSAFGSLKRFFRQKNRWKAAPVWQNQRSRRCPDKTQCSTQADPVWV